MKKYSKLMVVVMVSMMNLTAHADDYIGNFSVNQFLPHSTANEYGAGNQYRSHSINNRFGVYGNEYSPTSVNNEFASDAPVLRNSEGSYRGRLSTNQFDPDSVSNEFGQYGNRFNPESINNEYGAGNRFNPESPNNPFGTGLMIYGR